MVYVFYLRLAVFQAQASDNLKNYFWDILNSWHGQQYHTL